MHGAHRRPPPKATVPLAAAVTQEEATNSSFNASFKCYNVRRFTSSETPSSKWFICDSLNVLNTNEAFPKASATCSTAQATESASTLKPPVVPKRHPQQLRNIEPRAKPYGIEAFCTPDAAF